MMDSGTAYGRPKPRYRKELTEEEHRNHAGHYEAQTGQTLPEASQTA